MSRQGIVTLPPLQADLAISRSCARRDTGSGTHLAGDDLAPREPETAGPDPGAWPQTWYPTLWRCLGLLSLRTCAASWGDRGSPLTARATPVPAADMASFTGPGIHTHLLLAHYASDVVAGLAIGAILGK